MLLLSGLTENNVAPSLFGLGFSWEGGTNSMSVAVCKTRAPVHINLACGGAPSSPHSPPSPPLNSAWLLSRL